MLLIDILFKIGGQLPLQSRYRRRFTISCCRNGSCSRPNTLVFTSLIIFYFLTLQK